LDWLWLVWFLDLAMVKGDRRECLEKKNERKTRVSVIAF